MLILCVFWLFQTEGVGLFQSVSSLPWDGWGGFCQLFSLFVVVVCWYFCVNMTNSGCCAVLFQSLPWIGDGWGECGQLDLLLPPCSLCCKAFPPPSKVWKSVGDESESERWHCCVRQIFLIVFHTFTLKLSLWHFHTFTFTRQANLPDSKKAASLLDGPKSCGLSHRFRYFKIYTKNENN